MIFLDTNTCVYFLKGIHPEIKVRFASIKPGSIKIPSIVKAELLYGAEKSIKKKENLESISAFLDPFEIVPFDDSCTYEYSRIRADLERNGLLIGPNDLIIASIVLSHGAKLITHNLKEFRRIKGFKAETWII